MARVGFLVNPIAGLGGRVGLKGTDRVADEAVRRGALPVAPGKAREMLRALAELPQTEGISWITCSGPMGAQFLEAAGRPYEIAYTCVPPTQAADTERACRVFLDRKAELIVFVGGDGTARDIASVIEGRIPIVGIPSGVKMHSAVFGLHPASVAAMLADFVDGSTATVEAEVLDVDETEYRRGEWVVRIYATVKTLHEPTLIQAGKMMFEEVSDRDARDAIADHLIEEMDENPETLYLLGPGGTLRHVKERLGVAGTLLGVDAVCGRQLVAANLDEGGILGALGLYTSTRLVLSPVGAQGFLLGRGNLEISPEVIARIGVANIIVVATPDKLRHTPDLRVDTGDPNLDQRFVEKQYLFVVQGYHETKVHPIRA